MSTKRLAQEVERRKPLSDISNRSSETESGKRKIPSVEVGMNSGTETSNGRKKNKKTDQEKCYMDVSEVVEPSLNGTLKFL